MVDNNGIRGRKAFGRQSKQDRIYGEHQDAHSERYGYEETQLTHVFYARLARVVHV